MHLLALLGPLTNHDNDRLPYPPYSFLFFN